MGNSVKSTVDQLGSFVYWNGNLISEMSSYHIINTLKFLQERADDFKMQYELYLLESEEWPIKMSDAEISKIIEMDTQQFIKDTPIWKALLEELKVRNLYDYVKTKINIL